MNPAHCPLAIRQRFDRGAIHYDQNAEIQRKIAADLWSFYRKIHPDFRPKTFLDVGCGTGILSEICRKTFPGIGGTLADIGEKMLQKAREKLRENPCTYVQGDCEKLCFLAHDIILSNMALQWFQEPMKSILKLGKIGKIFAFSLPVIPTFAPWQILCRNYQLINEFNFLNANILEDKIRSQAPELQCHFQRRSYGLHFDRISDFIRHLQRVGAQGQTDPHNGPKLARLLKEERQPFSVSYHILFGVLSCNYSSREPTPTLAKPSRPHGFAPKAVMTIGNLSKPGILTNRMHPSSLP